MCRYPTVAQHLPLSSMGNQPFQLVHISERLQGQVYLIFNPNELKFNVRPLAAMPLLRADQGLSDPVKTIDHPDS